MGHIDVGYDLLPALFPFIADGSKQGLAKLESVFSKGIFIECLDIFLVLDFARFCETRDVGFPTSSRDVFPCCLPNQVLEVAIFFRNGTDGIDTCFNVRHKAFPVGLPEIEPWSLL